MNRFLLLRVQRGLTQEQVAEKSGLSRQTISRLEQGAEPNGPTIKRLADAYGLKVERLMLDKESAA